MQFEGWTHSTVGAATELAGEVSGSVDFEAGKALTTTTYAMRPELDVRLLTIGPASYMQQADDEGWTQLPEGTLNGVLPQVADLLTDNRFDEFGTGGSDPLLVEQDTVRGVRCDRYRVEGHVQTPPQLQTPDSDVPRADAKVQVCIDDDQFVRQLDLSISTELGGSRSVVEFHSYGSPVELDLPAELQK